LAVEAFVDFFQGALEWSCRIVFEKADDLEGGVGVGGTLDEDVD
jgi:hypothetical protein